MSLQGNGVEKMDTADETVKLLDEFETLVSSDAVTAGQTTPKQSRKRKSNDASSSQRKKKKASDAQNKNPLMRLNELKPGLRYTVDSQSGPPHNPSFEVSVLVNDEKYIGKGNSKQMAKHAAAQAALSAISMFQSPSETLNIFGQPSASADFTVDNVENEGCNFNKFELLKNGSEDGGVISTKVILPRLINEADKKNPVMLLNEIHPGLTYVFKEENSLAPSQRFCMVVEVNGKAYEGTGQSKKLAKASAARAVLSGLYKISYNLYSKTLAPNISKENDLLNFPQTVADQISKSLMSTYNEVMAVSPDYMKWKVIAGIAMTKDADMKDIQIITIGTGTKCISGEHISMVGANVNDCHAEIISRRCLKDFFYTNLELLLEGEAHESIFQKKDTAGYSLKPHIKFHLYISTAPCGDARIFSPHEEGIADAMDRHPNRNSRGVLRTKIESGEGTIPVRGKQAIQTWDSILPGQERLLTMSCSDKIASWNVLGLQGALLSYFIEPIYLDSVILGGLFNSNHLQRALFGRFESHLKDLPKMFRLTKPKMCATTSPEMRHLAKSPSFGVNWTLGLGRPEVINSTNGKTDGGQMSRLSKRAFFQRFLNIHDKLSHIDTFPTGFTPIYVNYKNAVKDYQAAQKALNSAFTAAGLGCWIKKPIEQGEFE